MAMTKEVLLTNARNDGRGWGIAGQARNDERKNKTPGRSAAGCFSKRA